MSVRFAARTDSGRRRRENQDQAIVRALPDGSVLLAVADGAGGLPAGAAASAAAIHAVEAVAADGAGDDPARLLERAVDVANRRVLAIGEADVEARGLASTLVLAVVRDGTAWIANIGDSRAMLFHDGALVRLTEDDSLVAEQVRAGVLTAEQARIAPHRNIITRSLGLAADAPVEVTQTDLGEGDVLLLSSDGLHGVLRDAEIAALLAEGDPATIAARLIAAANGAGGPDNIAVALAAERG